MEREESWSAIIPLKRSSNCTVRIHQATFKSQHAPPVTMLSCFYTFFVCLWTNKMNYLTKEGSHKSIMQLPGNDMTKYWHILTIN